MLSQIKINNKRGISVMIGYVLLVTFAIIISVVIYNWMQSYVPRDEVKCEDGVSLIIDDYNCNGEIMNITVTNNGRFSLSGFTIFAKNSSNAEIATIDLSKEVVRAEDSPYSNASGKIYFSNGSNTLHPNERFPGTFVFNISSYNSIPEVVITPIRKVEWNNKKMTSVCGNARIEETVNCG